MASKKNKIQNGGQDITLMTILSNEATGPSRKILKEYGEPDAKDYQDLEVKLAELYFKTPDKIVLEKKLASIHPHKKFILKNTDPKELEMILYPNGKEVKSNADGECECGCNKSNAEGDCPTMEKKTPYQNPEFLYADGGAQTQKFDYNGLIVPAMILTMMSVVLVAVLRTLPQNK